MAGAINKGGRSGYSTSDKKTEYRKDGFGSTNIEHGTSRIKRRRCIRAFMKCI